MKSPVVSQVLSLSISLYNVHTVNKPKHYEAVLTYCYQLKWSLYFSVNILRLSSLQCYTKNLS